MVKSMERKGTDPGPRSGDVVSFEQASATAPEVGVRMMAMLTFPRRRSDWPSETDFRVSKDGAWEVVYVRPIRNKLGKARVYVRAS